MRFPIAQHCFFAAVCAASVLVVFGLTAPVAEAQVEGKRVEFSVTVGSGDVPEDADRELRIQRQREITTEVVERMEKRLDAIGFNSHDVSATDLYRIDVTVYGDHSAATLKSALIPAGRLEVRPVIVDGSRWYDVAADLPTGVELRSQRGSFRTDSVFLFGHSARTLRGVIDRHDNGDQRLEVFPHEDGWRVLQLGPVAATERDVHRAGIDQNPSGIPFVRATFSARAAQQIRSASAASHSSDLAIIVDGEVVAVQSFGPNQFHDSLDLDPPSHLRSADARRHWAHQVAARLATPIPVRLVEIEE